MFKIAVITTHPIQYYAPFFKRLNEEKLLQLKVFYTWGEDVLCNKYDPDFGRNIQWDIPLLEGYDYHFTRNTAKKPGSSHFNGIITPDLIVEVKAYRPDAILIFGYAYQGHLKLMRYFKGKTPIWFRGDSTLLDEKKGWKSILKKLYLNWVYRHIDKALYVGEENKKYFQKYGLKENQLIFVPHAIDNNRFAEDLGKEALNLRGNLGIPEKAILILFAGKLEEKKNPEILLKAFTEIDGKTEEEVHLLFVGNGVLEERLKADALTILHTPTQFSVAKRVHFMDFQNQSYMPVIYQSCDLFCLPSKGPGETWGLAINEAMAAGKAVLVSDKVGCGANLLKQGINGFIFNSEYLTDLKEKLKLLMNKEKLNKMGIQSKAVVLKYSFAEQVKQIKKLIHD